MIFKKLLIYVLSFFIGFSTMKATIRSFEKSKPKKSSVVAVSSTKRPTETPTEKEYTKLKVIATAYCPCWECSEGYGRNTATGAIATAGRTIAVDPSVIPYGSEVIINGKTYVAEDCGGAVKGNRIDIFFDTHAETEEFGRQELTVLVSKSS